MNDTELDALLSAPLPERDAADFSVLLMERIADAQARPARILSWIMAGALALVVAAAAVWGAAMTSHSGPSLLIPAGLILLTLLLSFVVYRSAQE